MKGKKPLLYKKYMTIVPNNDRKLSSGIKISKRGKNFFAHIYFT